LVARDVRTNQLLKEVLGYAAIAIGVPVESRLEHVGETLAE
jgi:hypothetical protein